LDLIETKFFIGTKTMKFISDKKAGYIQKDWEVDESKNSFDTDNSFDEELDDFIDKKDVGVSP